MIKVEALRRIVTEAGTIEQGQIGFVPKEWYERMMAARCGCKRKAFRLV